MADIHIETPTSLSPAQRLRKFEERREASGGGAPGDRRPPEARGERRPRPLIPPAEPARLVRDEGDSTFPDRGRRVGGGETADRRRRPAVVAQGGERLHFGEPLDPRGANVDRDEVPNRDRDVAVRRRAEGVHPVGRGTPDDRERDRPIHPLLRRAEGVPHGPVNPPCPIEEDLVVADPRREVETGEGEQREGDRRGHAQPRQGGDEQRYENAGGSQQREVAVARRLELDETGGQRSEQHHDEAEAREASTPPPEEPPEERGRNDEPGRG